MKAAKPGVIVALVSLLVISTPLAALADDSEDDNGTSQGETRVPGQHSDHDNDNDDKFHGLIPPVFVIPGQGKVKHQRPSGKPSTPPTATPDPTTPDSGNGTGASLGGVQFPSGPTGDVSASDFVVVNANDPKSQGNVNEINPKLSAPVQIRAVQPNRLTPEQEFMNAAYLGMGALAVSALGLGITAGVRSIRLRKSEKNDYFYDN